MRRVLSVAAGLLVLIYPVAVYVGISRLQARELVFWLLPLLTLLLLSRLPQGTPRVATSRGQQWRDALKLPALMAGLLIATAFFDDHRFLLATPVLINLALLSGFGSTLRKGQTPLVERFARLQVDDLSPAELTYCRQVTKSWCVFFVVNGGVALLLALLAPLAWWALYTGLLSYLLIGLMGATEYIIRKARFGRFAEHLLDRTLRSLLQGRVSQ